MTGLPRWMWMLPVLLLSTALAAGGLYADAIWYDELSSIGFAGGLTGPFTIPGILADVQEHAPKHGPVFFLALAGWGGLVGWHHAALRVLPLLCGLLTLVWVYRIGKDFVHPRCGIWGALFLGVNVFWLDYFHDLKMYTMQIALLTAMLWHYLRLIQPAEPRRVHWLGLVSTAALALYTQPFSIFLFLAIGMHHLVFVAKTRRFWAVAAAYIGVGMLYLPWLPVTLRGVQTKFDTFDPMSLAQAGETFIRLFSNGNWIIALIPLAAAVLRLRARMTRRELRAVWALGILTLLLLLGANEIIGLIPMRRARYFLMAFPLLALIMGSGLAWLNPRRWTALLMLVFAISGFALRDAEDYLDYQGTSGVVRQYPPLAAYVAALEGRVADEDFLLGFSQANFVNIRGHHGKSTADYYLETLLGIDGAFLPLGTGIGDLPVRVKDMADDHPYLLLTYDPADERAIYASTRAVIERDYRACDVVLDTPRLRSQRFVYRALSCGRVYQPIDYAAGITIVDRFAEYDSAAAALRLVTGWEVRDEALLRQYNLSFQVLSADGAKALQHPDRHLYDNILKWHVAEMSLDALPPGDYIAVVIVYDRYSGGKIAGTDRLTGESGKFMPIVEFTVPPAESD